LSESCIFCRIIRGGLPSYKVYEDEKVFAFLDIFPSALGHTLIIPKVHAARIENLPPEAAESLFRALHRILGPIQEAMGVTASSVGINNGPESGQEVPHVHIHVIPRSRGDRGGIMQGLVRSTGRPRGEEMEEIAEKIRERLG
jgi:histidine triad (HIT) family protein